MERKTYTIFDSYDTYSDERKKEAKENIIENAFFDEDEDGCITVTDNFGKEVKVTREEYEKTITDERVTDECCFLEETWFTDERSELKRVSEGEVLAIASLGLWDGRRYGYKKVKSLEDIMYSSCDYERVFVYPR